MAENRGSVVPTGWWRSFVVLALVAVAAACAPPVTTSAGSSTGTVTVGGKVVTVAAPPGSTVTVAAVDPATVPGAPSGVAFPFGVLAIDVQGLAPGAGAVVTVSLPDPVSSVRKLISGAWDPFVPNGTTGASVSADGRTVTLDLLDGGRGDADGVADGTIKDPVAPATTVQTSGATDLAAGVASTCAVVAPDGHVSCWGANGLGQLGDGTTTDSSTPVTALGVSGATRIAVNQWYGHTCAIIGPAGTVKCWGSNSYGQLGNGNTTDQSTAVDVQGLAGATEVALGEDHSCALLAGGTVSCWGANFFGQLGDGSTDDRLVPVPVLSGGAPVTGATHLSAGRFFTCATFGDDSTACWGNTPAGLSASPLAVTPLVGATAISSSDFHSCALAGGGAWCWGFNISGQLGNTGVPVDFTNRPPVAVQGLSSTPVGIAAGGSQSCAVLTDGTVQCWGGNPLGSLGTGATDPQLTAATVAGVTDAVQVTTADHTCARRSDGTVLCWGFNGQGQLGDPGFTDPFSTTPRLVAGIG